MNCAWTVDGTMRQWIDLGIHTEVRMTRPETCGAAGGAISVLINVIDYFRLRAGIISSLTYRSSGLGINCFYNSIWYVLNTYTDI